MPKARCTKADITRAIDAWRAKDLPLGGIEIAPDGTIRVLAPIKLVDEPEDRGQSRGPKPWHR